jgi:N4-gp56 family major capsid protein
MFSMPEAGRASLKNWGVEKMETLAFTALGASPTKIFYKTSSGVTSTATAATAKAALTVADSKLTPAMVSWIKAWAMTGGARTQIPLRPVKIDGRNYFVMLVHPDVVYDWKQDSTVAQAWREAEIRGKENPIFKGASYIWDGVVIHESEYISIATDAGSGSNVPWAKCFFLGCQALVWAWGERPSIVEEDEDYGEDLFAAWRITAKVEKPVFNSVDYGSVCVYLSRSNVAGS